MTYETKRGLAIAWRAFLTTSVLCATFMTFRWGRHHGAQMNAPGAAVACVVEEDLLASPDCPCGCCYYCETTLISNCPGCGTFDDGEPSLPYDGPPPPTPAPYCAWWDFWCWF
jgi:hypothetical protein